MKILTAVICLNVLTLVCFGQDDVTNRHNLGLTYTLAGDNDMIKFQSLVGASSFTIDKSLSFGIVYYYQTSRKWVWETGLEYSKHDIYIQPAFNPDIDNTPRKTSLGLVTIPITLRYNIGKYFFLNGGTMLDVEIKYPESIDDQTGFGASFGIGVKYDFKFGTSVFINPNIRAHALIPFAKERYHDHLMESGIRFGVTQRF